MRYCHLLCGLLLCLMSVTTMADEFKPAYFRITELPGQDYDLMWKVPAVDAQTTLAVNPVLPESAVEIDVPRASYADGASVIRWRVHVPGGIEGKPIAFTGLVRTRIDILVRYERADGSEQVGRVLPIDPRFVPEASPGRFEVVQTYTVIGIEHILLGFDHLLFVLALVLIVHGTMRLLATITAFTLAHSITLVLATLGIVHVPGPPVEAFIALSIVFVAHEIIEQRRGHEGLAARKPWIIAFAFGLLHGLGFAGALAEVGLPTNALPTALLFFNVGVEIGQLVFVIAILTVAQLARRLFGERVPQAALRTATSYFIGGLASYWTIERVVSFWA